MDYPTMNQQYLTSMSNVTSNHDISLL